MVEEKKEVWLNYLALTTVVLAVCATVSTFKGGSYSTRSVLSQSQAANQWAFYQAKGGVLSGVNAEAAATRPSILIFAVLLFLDGHQG
jgi:hypothetical protein